MLDVCTIEEPDAAAAVLDPLRNRLLSEMRDPVSAAGLATRLGMPRQKVNYHLHALERLGLATVAEQRRWGGLTERLMVAKASSYVISPAAIGPIASDPERIADTLSAGYLIALSARVIREVAALVRGAREARKRLATLSIDTVIHFRSARERAAFTSELMTAINQLVAKYHDEAAEGARPHRLVLCAHPLPKAQEEEAQPCP